MRRLTTPYSPIQFSLVRILLGLYLAQYFLRLLPHSSELFSTAGMVSDVTLNYTYPITSLFIEFFTAPLAVTALLMSLMLLALLLAAGMYRQIAALLLWLGWLLLFNLNNLTDDPSLAFIGLLLLVFAATRCGEPLCWRGNFLRTDSDWEIPTITYWGMWFILGASFTISGLEKFASELWRSGEALLFFYYGPIAFTNPLVQWIAAWPNWIHYGVTWVILYSQLFAVGLILCNATRKIFWLLTTFLFTASLLLLDLTDVLLGMLIFYLFLFDSRWFQPYLPLTVWIDGECPICRQFAATIISEDVHHRITIATFQDQSLTGLLTTKEITAMKDMVASDGERLFRGDEAVIKIITQLGGIWASAHLLWYVPHRLRRAVYRRIARKRYCLSGCHTTTTTRPSIA